MSVNVDRTGVFRCKLLEHGIGKTREKGYPQLIIRVVLTELYDKDAIDDSCDGWCDVSDWGMETQGYVCLYGVKKKETSPSPTLGYDQVMKVFEWDGQSLAELAKGDYEGLDFQVRIEENNYEGAKHPFQVSWIDVYDADPVYTIKKLDPDEIKALDAQFSNITASAKKAASAKKKAPAKASAKKKPVPPKKQQKGDQPLTKEEKQRKLKEKSDRIKAAAKKQTAPPPPDDDESPNLPDPGGETLTKREAWNKIYEMRDQSIDDATIKELWDAAIEEVGGEGAMSKDLNGEQWYQVKEIVLADCGKF